MYGRAGRRKIFGRQPTGKLMSLTLEIRSNLESITEQQWNALNTDGNPFVRYEFMRGLEATGCLGADKGWYPQYFLLWQQSKSTAEETDNTTSDDADNEDFGELVAAMPTYIKTHSYGEFVFDWAWAEAFQRHGEDYYPKLVCAIPFTPATGPRLLVRDDQPFAACAKVMINTACQFASDQKFSGVHWLFTSPKDCVVLCGETERTQNDTEHTGSESVAIESHTQNNQTDESTNPPILRRMDCQYHWQNDSYKSFDDFLSRCTAKRRKTIKRERRYVSDADIYLERRSGSSLSDQEWSWVHQFYESTFEAKWGSPSLTEDFFKLMGSSFGESTLIVFAYDPNDHQPTKPIACSIMFLGGDCLYGRFWGCRQTHHCLHFEACYYQGIEHCIANNIARFEPGAQGEHKITRGFVPTLTESAHFIVHAGFREAIDKYLSEEKVHIRERCNGLTDLLPFKHDIAEPGPHADTVHSS